MGRAALGSAAKTEVISGRVTKAVQEEIVARYGSAAKFIAAMVKAQGLGERK